MLKFRMSGQTFEFDTDVDKITAEEFFLVDEILGATMDELVSALADGLTGERTLRGVIKEFCVTAFLAQRRKGGRRSWAEFSRTIAPATLELVPDEPVTPPPVTVGIDPNLGQQVPVPGRLEPSPSPLFDPSPAMTGEQDGGLHELYRAP